MRAIAIGALLTLGACASSSLDRVAETSFTLDHRRCPPTSVERRPDLAAARGAVTAYEMFGCGDHAAYFCAPQSVGDDGTVYGPSCSDVSF